MSDRDEADRVFAEAYAALARTADIKVEERRADADDDPQPRSLEGWRQRRAADRERTRQEIERRREAEERRAAELEQMRDALLQHRIDGRVEGALAPLRDAIGAVIGQERRKHRTQIETLEAHARLLQKQIDLLGEAQQQGHERGKGGAVIEVPSFIQRRGRGAA